MNDIQAIYKEVTEQVILERIFEKEEKLVHTVFTTKLAKECPEYLKSHQLRKLIFGRIVDKMFTAR